MAADGAAHYALEIDIGFGGDFSGDDDQAGGGESFAGDAAGGVFGEAGVEDGVRNLVGDLIGMAFGDGLGSEQITVLGCQVVCLLIARGIFIGRRERSASCT